MRHVIAAGLGRREPTQLTSGFGCLAVLAALSLPACQCEGPAVRSAPPPTAPELPAIEIDDDAVTLPSTDRRDLPEATPRVTVTVEPRGYRVDNRAVVESWPPNERALAARQASPLDPDFPIVEVAFAALDPAPLLLPELRDAMARARVADQARDPAASGTPMSFAIRGAGEVAWGRVLRALYAGAMVGFAEPSFLLRNAEGQTLALSVASGRTPMLGADPEAVRAALASLGVAPERIEAVPETAATPEGEGGVLTWALEEHGLRVRMGMLDLGPDCRTPSTDGSPTFPSASLTRATLASCLEAIGPFAEANFEAAPSLTYAQVMAVLPILHGAGRPFFLTTTSIE